MGCYRMEPGNGNILMCLLMNSIVLNTRVIYVQGAERESHKVKVVCGCFYKWFKGCDAIRRSSTSPH